MRGRARRAKPVNDRDYWICPLVECESNNRYVCEKPGGPEFQRTRADTQEWSHGTCVGRKERMAGREQAVRRRNDDLLRGEPLAGDGSDRKVPALQSSTLSGEP